MNRIVSPLDTRPDRTPIKEKDWVECVIAWAGFQPGELVGEVVKVGPASVIDTRTVWIRDPRRKEPDGSDDLIAVPGNACRFIGFPVAVGDFYDDVFDQELLECTIVEIRGDQFKVEIEDEGSSRRLRREGRRVKGTDILLYPKGERRREPNPLVDEEFGDVSVEKIG